MRIIVTNLGNTISKEFAKELNLNKKPENALNSPSLNKDANTSNVQLPPNLSQTSKNKKYSFLDSKSPQNNSLKKSPNRKRSKFTKSMDFLDNLNMDEIDKIANQTRVRVKQKKIVIPKIISDRYSNDNNYGHILPSFNITNLNEVGSDKLNTTKNVNQNFNTTEYTFREIIKINAQKKLKEKLRNDDERKKRGFKLTENHFRSNYIQDKPKAEKMEDLLDNRIDKKNISLIRYMNQQNYISDVFLNKINECDEDKITKLNKICPIVFQNKLKEESFNQAKKDKITEKQNAYSIKAKSDIENMKVGLNDSCRIFKEYVRSDEVDKYQKFRDTHLEIERKYWDKFQQDKYFYKNKYDYNEILERYAEKEKIKKFYQY